MHGCHLELRKKNSLTYFVQLLHKHGVRWTEKDVLKIVSVSQGIEHCPEWNEGSSAGRLPAEKDCSKRGKMHNVLNISDLGGERCKWKKNPTSILKKKPSKLNSSRSEYTFSTTWLYSQK